MNGPTGNDLETLAPLVEAGWNNVRVLVVGDVMLDRYAFGHVDRISPEAPVPVVKADRTVEQPGGAANVAMNIARLGASVVLGGFRGLDHDGSRLQELLDEAGIESLLVCVEGTPTTSKLRILGGNQQIVRLDYESSSQHPGMAYEELVSKLTAVLPTVSAVVLSDYAKGALTPHMCQRLIGSAKNLGIPVLVDPKGRDFFRYDGATTICPNLLELSLVTTEGVHDIEVLLERSRHLVNKHRLEYLTVTMSERGIAVLGSVECFRAPAVARQVFDVSGAGDTVIATLALCAANKVDVRLAAALANVAAGVVIAKVGTVPVTRSELLAELRRPESTLSQKTLTPAELTSKVAMWRKGGDKIVFTNGCFDLLHAGHLSLLEQSKLFGDRLVIGINSDASIRTLKGPTRPVIEQHERARLLSALAASDAVVVFEEVTPISIIRAIRPDVLVKGGDYTEDTVVGAAEVAAWGGRVELVPLLPGFSTTDILERLVDKGGRRSRAEARPC